MRYPHATLMRFSSALVGFLMLSLLSPFSAKANPSYSYGFESDLAGWAENGTDTGSVSIISEGCPEGKKCVRISKTDRIGYTFIGRRFSVPSNGTLILSAKVRVPSLAKGQLFYHIAKFQAAIIRDGREISWPNDDISTPVSTWIQRTIKAVDLKPTDEIRLRIGLQDARGIIDVDDVVVKFISD